MASTLIGIDPGLTGAIAFYDRAAHTLIEVVDIPTFRPDKKTAEINAPVIAALISQFAPRLTEIVIENVAGGIRGQRVSSVANANFCEGYGVIRGIIHGLGMIEHRVRPQIWKKALKLGRDKTESRQLATKLFPQHAERFARIKDDGRAEAALIAHYADRWLLAPLREGEAA